MDKIDEILAKLSPRVRAMSMRGSEVEPPVYETWEDEMAARMR